jgi:hypothetical protein
MELYCTSQFSTLLTIAQDILHALREQGKTLAILVISVVVVVVIVNFYIYFIFRK